MRPIPSPEFQFNLLSSVVHDLRIPLSAIRAYSELLETKGNLENGHQLILKKIQEGIDRMNSMLHELMDGYPIQADGQPLSFPHEICDLTKIAEAVSEELAAIHGDRFAVRATHPVIGIGNQMGIRRILANLCNNAAKYGDPAGPITVSFCQSMPEWVRVHVHNFGNPLSQSELVEVFHPFRRTLSAKNSGQQGWGIGLSLSQNIAKSLGGKICVQSSPQEGTYFTLCLPHANRS